VLEVVETLLASTLDYAPALILAALGAVLSERAGVVALGIEGMMRVGAFSAAVAALIMPTPLALLVGMAAGGLFAGVHALLCVTLRAQQIVSGMALNLLALAGGTFLLESYFQPSGTPSIQPLASLRWPALESVPLLRALSGHSFLTFLALLLPLLLQGFFARTPTGLRLRAVGERPLAVATAGLSVERLRIAAVVSGGVLAGLGGAALSTATLDRFEQHMPAGLGFMALAALVFGRWRPIAVAAAGAFFAAGNALRIALAGRSGLLAQVPNGFWLALPYLLTLLVLTVGGDRSRPPAALGVPYHPEQRD
jgi:simple sugar transport system permease protein